jgi:hypothetical protein
MNRVAARLCAATPPASSVQRTVNALWINTLNGVAAEIAQITTAAAIPRTIPAISTA